VANYTTGTMGGGAAIYYAWNRQAETGAPLGVIENRFPALFESRRMLYPRYSELSDPALYDQGIGGFLDHIQRRNFVAFSDLAARLTGAPVYEMERGDDQGRVHPITEVLDSGINTLIVISFDSIRTGQAASSEETAAIREFLSSSEHLVFVAPHHDIGDDPEREFFHHGDRTLPPEQRFGGYARSLLTSLGLPVENRFGLRPAVDPEGRAAPLEPDRGLDRLGFLEGVATFNVHPHLPHLERTSESIDKLDVLARQPIDLDAPPHSFTAEGRSTFDALLQSRPEVFPGILLVGDTTLFSSTAGGVDSLTRLWANVIGRASQTTQPAGHRRRQD
jgi:hypothetical protein